jgi:hypothetical protein
MNIEDESLDMPLQKLEAAWMGMPSLALKVTRREALRLYCEKLAKMPKAQAEQG